MTVNLLIIQIGSVWVPWFIIFYLGNNFGLGAVGDFSLTVAVISPLIIFLSNPNRNYIIVNKDFSYFNILATRFFLVCIGALIAYFLGYYYGFILLFIVFYLMRSAEQLFDIPIAISIIKRNTRYIYFVVLIKTFGIVSFSLAIWFFHRFEFFLSVLAVYYFVFILFGVGYENKIFDLKNVYKCFFSGLPLAIFSIFASLQANVPRYVLINGIDHDVLAIYSITTYIILPVILVLNGYWQSRLPIISRLAIDNNGKKTVIKKMIFSSFFLWAILQVAQNNSLMELFFKIHGVDNIENDLYISVYRSVLGLSFLPIIYSVFNYLLISICANRALLFLSVFSAFISLALSYFFNIYIYGVGAVLGYYFGCFVHAIFVLFCFYRFKIK